MRSHVFAVLFFVGCVGDGSTVTDAGTDGGVGVDAAKNDAANDAPVVDASCGDTQSDSKNCGACGHDCLGGQCSAGVCQIATLVTGQGQVTSIVPTATNVYWARASSTVQHGGVFASDLSGQNLVTLYDAGATTSCSGLQVDGTSAAYFYCGTTFYKCALPSCAQTPTPLLSVPSVNATALDSTNHAIYFVVGTPYNQQTGGFIASFPLAGGTYTRLVAADQPSPSSLLINNGIVYWLDSGTYTNDNFTGNGGVRSAPLGVNQTATELVNDTSAGDYSGIALQGSTIYYGAGSANAIHSVATIGGSFSPYTTSTVSELNVVLATPKGVYWAESNSNATLFKCQLNSCGTPTTIATGQMYPSPLVEDAASIWWASGGQLRRLAQ